MCNVAPRRRDSTFVFLNTLGAQLLADATYAYGCKTPLRPLTAALGARIPQFRAPRSEKGSSAKFQVEGRFSRLLTSIGPVELRAIALPPRQSQILDRSKPSGISRDEADRIVRMPTSENELSASASAHVQQLLRPRYARVSSAVCALLKHKPTPLPVPKGAKNF